MTIGRKNKRRRGSMNLSAATAGGFTLLELIAVMILISIVLAMAAPSLRGFFAARQTADAAMRVVALAQHARSEAIALGRCCRLNIDPESRSLWVTVQQAGAFAPARGEAGRGFQLPEGASARLQSESADLSAPYVLFYPSGRSQTAAIEITGRRGEVFLVTCRSPTDPFRIVSPAEAGKL